MEQLLKILINRELCKNIFLKKNHHFHQKKCARSQTNTFKHVEGSPRSVFPDDQTACFGPQIGSILLFPDQETEGPQRETDRIEHRQDHNDDGYGPDILLRHHADHREPFGTLSWLSVDLVQKLLEFLAVQQQEKHADRDQQKGGRGRAGKSREPQIIVQVKQGCGD